MSASPSPPPPVIPSIIPTTVITEDQRAQDAALKDKFKKFWMLSVADAFQGDLEQLRKEPNMNTNRLSLLIDSLASGADVYTRSSSITPQQVAEEMKLVLDTT